MKITYFIGRYLTFKIVFGSSVTAVDMLPTLTVRISTLNAVQELRT
jgi:hypothetical protein